MTIYLCGVPGSSAGRVIGTCFALHRTGFGKPDVSPRPLVGSYPTFSPLPASVSLGRRSPFCSTFRRLSPPGPPDRDELDGANQRPALRCPDFPRAALLETTVRPAVTRPARLMVARLQVFPVLRRVSRGTPHTRRPPEREARTPRTRGIPCSRHERAPTTPGRACDSAVPGWRGLAGGVAAHPRVRNTPVTLPRISTCSG